MSVLDRTALEASPLADLHAIASELLIDGYRRLRRAELIDAILDKQEGTERPAPQRRRAARGGGRGGRAAEEERRLGAAAAGVAVAHARPPAPRRMS